MASGLIERAVEAEIARRVKRGELILPCDHDKNLDENLDCLTKMMTIAVHRGLGIGKKRFREKVNPELAWIENLYYEERKKSDQVYALSIIDRMYDQIMEG
jgi:hypothetical protein